ncbi:hypothetical protein CONLIGDRAFT_675912 [Coniochaeta ligniaria NRRL 30616]|uniref:Uncharacterized protein n=1 Tax=Coniochaeta ligniaria NRRL 30616 TaxID=1408157 RepID=A0A1J7J4C8_9PEZI|nr:hypothetical protein CONLIGDRAFT_675912 [Coniochaeta ligniaria NRRL 30616]
MGKGGTSKKCQHHCPRAKFGGPPCHKVKHSELGVRYCETHEWVCRKHPKLRPLLNQECRSCEMRDRIVPEREEKKAKQEEIQKTNPKIAKWNAKDYTPP